jgi:hypothetical protein
LSCLVVEVESMGEPSGAAGVPCSGTTLTRSSHASGRDAELFIATNSQPNRGSDAP